MNKSDVSIANDLAPLFVSGNAMLDASVQAGSFSDFASVANSLSKH